MRRATHIKANVDCAVKIIKKKAIQEHQILIDLMHNELKVLEETVSLTSLLPLLPPLSWFIHILIIYLYLYTLPKYLDSSTHHENI